MAPLSHKAGQTACFSATRNATVSRAPIAGPAAWHDAIQIKILQDPTHVPVPALVPSQTRQQLGISMVTHSAGPHRQRRYGRLWPIAIARPAWLMPAR